METGETPAADAGAGEVAAPAPVAADAPPAAPDVVVPAYQGSSGPRRPSAKRFPRRKVCAFCVDKIDYIDYKDAKRLRKYVSERGKIVPRRISGNCAAHQRLLTTALKRARVIALIPYTTE